jgi:hypothetical protein
MQNVIFVLIPLLIFAYTAVNGLTMAISPLKWAQAKWTAKGQYGYDEVARQVRNGKAPYWRAAGVGMAILSIAAIILVTGWMH